MLLLDVVSFHFNNYRRSNFVCINVCAINLKINKKITVITIIFLNTLLNAAYWLNKYKYKYK